MSSALQFPVPGLAAIIAVLVIAAACSPDRSESGPSSVDRSMERDARPAELLLVAHRGASGYAPEHTMQAYELALEQGADILEPDLQMTSDGVLIAFHDLTLNRTTDVAEVFPDRYREETVDGRSVRRWYIHDFTLDEIRRLDAGSWFGEEFRGARVMTFDEVIKVALEGEAGIFPETKSPEVYRDLGLDMERGLLADLERHGLHVPGAVPATPVLIQSFSEESLRIFRDDLGTELHLTLLVTGGGAERWLALEGLSDARVFADGIGPNKNLVLADPEMVARAHALDLTVIPWTFRVGSTGDFPDVTSEMAHFLFELGVDGLFTNNPDLFPRKPPNEGPGSEE